MCTGATEKLHIDYETFGGYPMAGLVSLLAFSDDRACLSEALETVLNKIQEPQQGWTLQRKERSGPFESINLILHFKGQK